MRKEILLAVMIGLDFSMHLMECLGIYPPWLVFPSREVYTAFWTLYWGIALMLIVMAVIDRHFERKERDAG